MVPVLAALKQAPFCFLDMLIRETAHPFTYRSKIAIIMGKFGGTNGLRAAASL